jgi:hypothetical protein
LSTVGSRSVLVFVTETRTWLPSIRSIVVFDAFEPGGIEDDEITYGPEVEGPALTEVGSGSDG